MRKKLKIGGGIVVLLIIVLEHVGQILARYLYSIPNHLDDDDSEFHLGERAEADAVQAMGEGVVPIHLKFIHFGDLTIECPECGTPADEIGIGLGVAEDTESEDTEFNDLQSVGLITYPCDHIVYAKCLTDKIAMILNAEEHDHLSPEMFLNLACEHGEENGST